MTGNNYCPNYITAMILTIGDNSLQFTSSNDMYYISSWYSLNVNHLKFEEAFCKNPAIPIIEIGYEAP
jgi:hypothetical protein